MKKKIYAVKSGRKTGIFNEWQKCLEQIHKYPNEKFQGFEYCSELEEEPENVPGSLRYAIKEAKEFLLTKGTDLSYGARPLRRAIQRYVEDELSDRILRAELNDGQKVEITRNEETDQLVFLITD